MSKEDSVKKYQDAALEALGQVYDAGKEEGYATGYEEGRNSGGEVQPAPAPSDDETPFSQDDLDKAKAEQSSLDQKAIDDLKSQVVSLQEQADSLKSDDASDKSKIESLQSAIDSINSIVDRFGAALKPADQSSDLPQ